MKSNYKKVCRNLRGWMVSVLVVSLALKLAPCLAALSVQRGQKHVRYEEVVGVLSSRHYFQLLTIMDGPFEGGRDGLLVEGWTVGFQKVRNI